VTCKHPRGRWEERNHDYDKAGKEWDDNGQQPVCGMHRRQGDEREPSPKDGGENSRPDTDTGHVVSVRRASLDPEASGSTVPTSLATCSLPERSSKEFPAIRPFTKRTDHSGFPSARAALKDDL